MDIILPTRFNNPNLPIVQRPGFSDDFNRPAADALGVTSGEARPWQNVDAGSITAVWGTSGNGTALLKTASSNRQCVVVDSLASDGELSATLSAVPSTRWGGLSLRVQDMDNCIYVSEPGSGISTVAINQRLGGAQSNLGTSTETVAAGDRITVTLSGPLVEVYKNGTRILTATTGILQGTRHGLYSWNPGEDSAAEWDSIEFTPA